MSQLPLRSRGTDRVRSRFFCALLLLPLVWPAAVGAQERAEANFKQAEKYSGRFLRQFSYGTSVTPRWIGESDRFWYSYKTSDGTRFWIVDPDAQTKRPLFDHDVLAGLLSESCKKALDSANLNLGRLEIDDDGKKLTFQTEGLKFEFELESGKLKNLGKAPKRPAASASRFGRGGRTVTL